MTSSADASHRTAIHSPTHVALATLVGTPLAGVLLLSRNDAALGQPGQSRALIIPAVLLGVGLAFGFYTAPQHAVLWGGISVVLAGLASVLAWNRQGTAFREHVHAGGPVTHAAFAVLTGAVCMGMLLGIAYAVSHVALVDQGGRVEFKGNQYVYYASGGLEAEARDVGRFLSRTPYPGDPMPFFNGDHPADARVTHDGDTVVVSFVVNAGAWDNDATRSGYQALGQVLGQELFPARRLRVDLADAHWVPRHQQDIR